MNLRISKILSIAIIVALPLNGQDTDSDSPRNAILKSLVLPGLGHLSMDHHQKARAFLVTEGTIWATVFTAASLYQGFNKNLRGWAVSHAGNTFTEKPDLYYFNMGQYMSLKDYNDQMMRQRRIDALYPDNESYRWSWDSDENQAKFRELRRISINANKVVKFAIGSLVLNRAISAIHVLYLHSAAPGVTGWVLPESNGARLGFTFDL